MIRGPPVPVNSMPSPLLAAEGRSRIEEHSVLIHSARSLALVRFDLNRVPPATGSER